MLQNSILIRETFILSTIIYSLINKPHVQFFVWILSIRQSEIKPFAYTNMHEEDTRVIHRSSVSEGNFTAEVMTDFLIAQLLNQKTTDGD